jgi:hypothetical protein
MAESPPVKKQEPNETAVAIQQLAEAMLAQAPKSPLEMSGMSKEKQRELTEPGVPKRWRVIPGKSEETGSTFDLHVVESKQFPHGRIVALGNYKHPEGMFQFQSVGGKVPDGFPMFNTNSVPNIPEGQEVPRHLLSQRYLQWRWTTFWQADLKNINGKGLKAHHCVHDDGLKTPWQPGKAALQADAAE